MQWRCSGGAEEVQWRCSVDAGEVQWRCKEDLAPVEDVVEAIGGGRRPRGGEELVGDALQARLEGLILLGVGP